MQPVAVPVSGATQPVAVPVSGATQPITTLHSSLQIKSRYPQQAHCPTCNRITYTKIHYVNGLATWLSVGGLVVMQCWMGCCLIPLCIDGLKDVEHSCSQCGTFIGKNKLL
eukprot:163654_1